MIQHPIEGDYRTWVINAFRQSPLFAALDQASIDKVAASCQLVEFEPRELIIREGQASDRFWVMLMGEAIAYMTDSRTGEQIELDPIGPNMTIGEAGLITDEPRTATVVTTKQSYAVQFDRRGFDFLMDRVPGFARRLARSIAERSSTANQRASFPLVASEEIGAPPADVVALFTPELIRNRRMFPIRKSGNLVTVGFVDAPEREGTTAARRALGELNMKVVRISMADFDRLLDKFELKPPPEIKTVTVAAKAHHDDERQLPLREGKKGRRDMASGTHKSVVASIEQLKVLEPLLRRMVQAGASDLHLSALQRPRWRLDGDIFEIPDFGIQGEEEILDLFAGCLAGNAAAEFEEHNDADFSVTVEGIARFRVNMYREENGVSAALRLVPMTVPSMDQLGLPKAARTFCGLGSGLVLVCGPTGSGKSTTLASMIDFLNSTRRCHIVTIEDPIEFSHTSKMAIMSQREVGKNTSSFMRGLRASLREDPDIVLVGELRDTETMELALKTAQTGHLVLSTLHTTTAIGTVDRIIDMFPPEQHNQVRGVLADVLKGVINQQLCKRVGGGRIAAYECLVGSSAVANCVRQAKNIQIATIMTTNKKEGHRMMNEDLAELVMSKAVDLAEAMAHSYDRKDLKARLGMPGD